MKKHKLTKTLIVGAAALLLLNGCGKKAPSKTSDDGTSPMASSTPDNPGEIETVAGSEAPAPMKAAPSPGQQGAGETPDYGMPEEGVSRAMVLADPYGNLYYVDVNVGTFFTASIPDDLTDPDGNPVSPGDITAGCVVDIYGNGIMLESYPGQYPGISKMILLHEGDETNAAPYQYLIDEISMLADPAEPPSMNAEYQTALASAAVMLTRGNYEWSYIDENGMGQNVIACGSHILQWPLLNDIRMNGMDTLDLTLTASRKPTSVTVTKFPLELWNNTENPAEVTEEAVAVQSADGVYTMTAEPEYVYLVETEWEEGRAEFGFFTK